MLQNTFHRVYTKFKLHFYQMVFERWQNRETSLTTVETYCMEIIYALNKPTVNEFATTANLSSPNAAYKVSKLINKGYIRKVQSMEDKREYHLEVTDKYLEYYNINYQYHETVMRRVQERFTPEELQVLIKVMKVMDEELMPEVMLPDSEE